MAKLSVMSSLPPGKVAVNLSWESAHEPPFTFTFPDVPSQAGAVHASPGALRSGKIAGWK